MRRDTFLKSLAALAAAGSLITLVGFPDNAVPGQVDAELVLAGRIVEGQVDARVYLVDLDGRRIDKVLASRIPEPDATATESLEDAGKAG